jgi:primase-polymerase (primpol)-like protein
MPSGTAAKVNDPMTWTHSIATISNPLSAPGAFDGIGFVINAEDGFVGIDLDDCVNADGSLTPLAQRLVASLRTYLEYSPSGRGLRAFIKGSLPQEYGAGLNRTAPSGERIEAYQHSHYLTLTGAHLPDTPLTIEPLREAFDGLLTSELPASSTGGFSMDEHPFFRNPQRSYRLGDAAIPPPVDGGDATIIRRLIDKLGAPFNALFYGGNIEAYGGDESKADFGFLCNIARECGSDPQLLDRIYRRSALYRRPGRAAKCDARHSADGRT